MSIQSRQRPFDMRNSAVFVLDEVMRADIPSLDKAICLMAGCGCGHCDGEIFFSESHLVSIAHCFRNENVTVAQVRQILNAHFEGSWRIQFEVQDAPRNIATAISKRRAISPTKALALFARNGYRCVACGSSDNLTVDHIYPVALGGGNEDENLQTLCRSCNSRKGTRLVGESI